jgi:Response regulator containing a CheY-like receiver domain and an HTH DNA-binding domain
MNSKPVKVLIADDSHDFSTMLKFCISLYPDIEVVGTAKNGVEVLALLDKLKPDVLLLDIIMPEMDGLEVLRRLHRMRANAPYVFILSAVSNESVAFESINMGATYLLKPIEAEMIISKIRSVMHRSKPSEAV